ncbi:MAG: HAMP domain-containing protein, partial [Desulfobacteraceae bacterium]
MSVKYRITLLVTAAGFIASLLFSVVIFYELIEQPFYVLDFELAEEANRAVSLIEENQIKSQLNILNPHILDTFPTWLKIYELNSERVLWKSKIADQISIPAVKPGSATIADAVIHDDKIYYGQGSSEKAAFRTQTFELMTDGIKLNVQVALPMVKLKEEIRELLIGIIAGLILSTLVLVVISYFVAGRILKPIGAMKDLALNISEKNLDQRIPVKKDKDEFNELARTINTMLDRLQFSFVRQRDFLFDTSHELKTPLTTIRLAIDDICSSEITSNSQPPPSENFLRITKQVIRMERLIKDLLNLSSLEILTSVDPKPIN